MSNEESLMEWTRYVLPPALALITSVTIFGNLFVLIDFGKRLWTSSQRVTPTHYFIANLACADFLVGLVVLPFLAVVHISGEWHLGREWCSGWTFLHFMLCAASILSTCMVCVDRYVGVKYPIKYREVFKPSRIAGILLVLWGIAATPAGLRVFIWSTEESTEEHWESCDLRQELWTTVVACVIVLYIPAAVMAVLYTKIYGIASEHLRKQRERRIVRVAETSSGSVSSRSGLTRQTSFGSHYSEDEGEVRPIRRVEGGRKLTSEERQIRLAKRLFFLVAVLVLSYFPYFTLILLRSVWPDVVSGQVFRIFAWLRYFNSCLNPFIYAYAVPDYRHSLKRSLSKVTKRWDTVVIIPPVGTSSLK